MNWRDKLKATEASVSNSGVTAAFFNFFQGRATTFAIAFTITGIILAFRGKLTMEFVGLVTAIQGLVFAHSCKEDWASQKQSTTVVNNTDVQK